MTGMWLVVATSCHWGGTVYHQFRAVPEGWSQTDTLLFALPPLSDGADKGRMFVDVRYTEKFPYRDLWLLVRHNMAGSVHWQTDTLCCPLFDKEGHPLGDGLLELFQTEVPYATVVPPDSGHACVQIVHCMADDSLEGVSDVGIRIEW